MAYAGPKIRWRKPKKYRNDVIATAKATGSVQRFWNSLLVGDELTLVSIADDEEYDYLIDAVYDTSDIDEWKSFRFNYRCLSRCTQTSPCKLGWMKFKLLPVVSKLRICLCNQSPLCRQDCGRCATSRS